MTLTKQNGILFPQWPRETLLYSRRQMDLQLYFAVYIYSDLTIINNDSIKSLEYRAERGRYVGV